jgi:hypothetical protein
MAKTDELERIRIEAVAAYCKVKFQHLLKGTSKAALKRRANHSDVAFSIIWI